MNNRYTLRKRFKFISYFMASSDAGFRELKHLLTSLRFSCPLNRSYNGQKDLDLSPNQKEN